MLGRTTTYLFKLRQFPQLFTKTKCTISFTSTHLDGWQDGDDRGCFKFMETAIGLNWVEAQQKCEDIGGYLAEPRTHRYTLLHSLSITGSEHTAKTQYHGNKYSQKGIAQPQSQFPHSCVCKQFIYSHDRSAYSSSGKYVDRSWEYINRSQTHECGNWDCGRATPFLGIHQWECCCSA